MEIYKMTKNNMLMEKLLVINNNYFSNISSALLHY